MKRLYALALSVVAGLTGCSNDDLVLLLTDVPAGIERLEIVASLDSRALQRAYTNGLSSSVVLDLPSGSQGAVSATLNGLDSRGCRTATAEVQVNYQRGGGRPTVVPVALAPLPAPECPLTVQVTGAGEVSSAPDVIRCSSTGPASTCRKYLREGLQVQLAAKSPAGSYVTWSQACTGLGGCIVQMNGQVTVGAAFKPTAQCTQPSCWTQDVAASSTSGLGYLSAIWGSAADNIWAASQFGPLYHYDGSAWNSVAIDNQNVINIRKFWGSGSQDIWAVGNRVILHYDGTQWSIVNQGTFISYLADIHGSSQSDIWAVGENGLPGDMPLILHYNGSAWSESFRPTNDLLGVLALRPNLAWAVGRGGTVLKWDGMSWVQDMTVRGVTTQMLRSLYGTSESSLWVVGDDTLLHFDGSRWTSAASAAVTQGQLLSGLWGTGDGNLWAVGYSNVILHRSDSGWGIDPHTRASSHNLEGIWGASPQDIWAVGGDGAKGVFYRYVPR